MAFFLLFSLFISISVSSEELKMNFKSSDVKSIKVTLPRGKISLLSSKNQRDISLRITENERVSKNSKKCNNKVGLENDQLVIDISSENLLFEKADCDFDVLILTPAKETYLIDLSSMSATINVKDVSGPLNLKTATGSVEVVSDVLKNVNAKTATGQMDFRYKTCQGRADVDLLSATARVSLTLPINCKIRVDYKSATGKMFNAIGESEDYQVLINAKSASGDLSIKKH